MAAKERLGMAPIMLAQVTTPSEFGLGSTIRVSAAPASPIWEGEAKIL